MIHLALLALAVFFVWETARAVLPISLPGFVNAVLLLAATWALDTYVPERYLALGAVVAVVAVLTQRFGSNQSQPTVVRFRDRRAAERAGGRIPPLP